MYSKELELIAIHYGVDGEGNPIINQEN